MEYSIEPPIVKDLVQICETCPVGLFYPIVYRLRLSPIPLERRELESGSAAAGSQEVLIRDLREDEFDILFGDDHRSEMLARIMDPLLESDEALDLLKRACK